jgi:hypothetical protein
MDTPVVKDAEVDVSQPAVNPDLANPTGEVDSPAAEPEQNENTVSISDIISDAKTVEKPDGANGQPQKDKEPEKPAFYKSQEEVDQAFKHRFAKYEKTSKEQAAEIARLKAEIANKTIEDEAAKYAKDNSVNIDIARVVVKDKAPKPEPAPAPKEAEDVDENDAQLDAEINEAFELYGDDFEEGEFNRLLTEASMNDADFLEAIKTKTIAQAFKPIWKKHLRGETESPAAPAAAPNIPTPNRPTGKTGTLDLSKGDAWKQIDEQLKRGYTVEI